MAARVTNRGGRGKPAPGRAGDSYLALVREYPLHPIRSDEDLDRAIEVLDSLLARKEPPDAQERDYLETLIVLIGLYEDEHVPMPEVSGAEMLHYLLGEHDKTISQVAKDTGIAVSTLSAVLRGKRELNRGHIERLAPYFGVEPGVFLLG